MAREQSAETVIAAPKARVWEVLADLETVQDYDGNVQRAHYLSETREGVGAARQCDLPDGTSVHERVTAWHEGDGYSIAVVEDDEYDLTDQAVDFQLEEHDGGTAVRMNYSYELKPGVATTGDEADAMAAEIVAGVLGGLKQFIETGERVEMPVAAAPSG